MADSLICSIPSTSQPKERKADLLSRSLPCAARLLIAPNDRVVGHMKWWLLPDITVTLLYARSGGRCDLLCSPGW